MPKIHNLLRFAVMLLLSQKPAHGYELIRQLHLALGRHVSASHVYPFLHELQKKGWVSSSTRKEKKIFRLTQKGKNEVKKLLAQFGVIVEAFLSSKISSCAHCGCKVFKGGFRKSGKLFCCEFCAMAAKRAF